MSDRKYSISSQIAWLTLVPLLVMSITLEAFFLHDRFVNLDSELLTRGQLIARQLAASSEYGVFSNNRIFLRSLTESALREKDVQEVVVLNAASEILVSSSEAPETLSANAGSMRNTALDSSTHVLARSGEEESLGLVSRAAPVFDRGDVVLLYQPILSTQLALDEIGSKPTVQQTGAVIVKMSKLRTRSKKYNLLILTLLATSAFLMVTLYLILLASRRIINPITRLSAAIHAIGQGQLDTRVTMPSHITELCTLTTGINQMATDLQHERAVLQHRIDEATQQLRDLAFYDTLTKLPNRRLLNDRFGRALAISKRSGCYGALMFLDLDNFKPINDQYGHAVGDSLLVEVAERIRGCLREMDTVARFGGDEFVVMLGELDVDHEKSLNQAKLVAEKIGTVLRETYYLLRKQEGKPETRIEHHCTSSIGIVLFPQPGASQEDLMRWADTAMYQAKQNGRNQIHFYEQ